MNADFSRIKYYKPVAIWQQDILAQDLYIQMLPAEVYRDISD